MRYLAVLEYGSNNYSAYIPDILGCVATGKTLELVKNSISEALAVHLDGEIYPHVATLDATGIELADGDTVVWIEPAPMNPISLLKKCTKVHSRGNSLSVDTTLLIFKLQEDGNSSPG